MGVGGKTTAGYGYFTVQKTKLEPASTATRIPIANQSPLPASTTSHTISRPPEGLIWEKGKISKDGQKVASLKNPDQALRFQKEQTIPKGWTPARKEIVDYAREELPDGTKRVWVKKQYYSVT
jgi:hypothetical protein